MRRLIIALAVGLPLLLVPPAAAQTGIPIEVLPLPQAPAVIAAPQMLQVITGGAELARREPYQFTLDDLRRGLADLFKLPAWIEGEVAKTVFARIGAEQLKLGLIVFLVAWGLLLVGLGWVSRRLGRLLEGFGERFRARAGEDFGSRIIFALITFARKNIFLPLALLMVWGIIWAVHLPASLSVSILATLIALTIYWPLHVLLVLLYDPKDTGTRLINLETKAARKIYWWLQISLSVLVFPLLAIFLLEFHGYRPAAIEFLHFAFRILVALCAVWALFFRKTLFSWEEPPVEGLPRLVYQWGYRLYHPFVVGLLLLFGAAGLGYRNFSNFILGRVGLVALVVFGALAVRRVLRDLVRNFVRSQARDEVARFHTGEEVVTETLRPALDLIVRWGLPVAAAWCLVNILDLSWAALGLEGIHHLLVTPFVKAHDTHISVASIAAAALVFVLIRLGSRVVQGVVADFVFPWIKVDAGLRYAIGVCLNYLFLAVALIGAITTIGLHWATLAVFMGAVGVGVGLGLQKLAGNFLSGLTILFELPIRRGDCVRIGDHEGIVHKIGARSTVLATRDNAFVIVPNSDVMEKAVVNWNYLDPKSRVQIPFGVAYGSDLAKIDRIVLEIARAHPAIMQKPPPQVILKGFGASSLDMVLLAWVADPTIGIADDINRAIDAAFRKEGIEIPFPQSDIHFRTALDVLKKDV